MREKVSVRSSSPKFLSKSYHRNPKKAPKIDRIRFPSWLILSFRFLIIILLINLLVGKNQTIPKIIRVSSASVIRFQTLKKLFWRVNFSIIGVISSILVKSLINILSLWLRWLIFWGFKYNLGYRARVRHRREMMFQILSCVWAVLINPCRGIVIIGLGSVEVVNVLQNWFLEEIGFLSINIGFTLNAIGKVHVQLWYVDLIFWFYFCVLFFKYKRTLFRLEMSKFSSVLFSLFYKCILFELSLKFLSKFLSLLFCLCVRMQSFKDYCAGICKSGSYYCCWRGISFYASLRELP